MLIDDYLEYQSKYEKKYGSNTIVLMEVGHFFEFYGIDNQKEKLGNVQEVSELLNIQMTRRNRRAEYTSCPCRVPRAPASSSSSGGPSTPKIQIA